jgi:hypothetical protein
MESQRWREAVMVMLVFLAVLTTTDRYALLEWSCFRKNAQRSGGPRKPAVKPHQSRVAANARPPLDWGAGRPRPLTGGMKGLDLLKHLAAAGSRVPVIILTAHGDEEARRQSLEAGAVAVLGRPFHSDAPLDAVRAALGM